MTTTTLDIFNLLVDAGIDAEKAKPLAKEILTRAEAKEVLVSKTDLLEFRQTSSPPAATPARATNHQYRREGGSGAVASNPESPDPMK